MTHAHVPTSSIGSHIDAVRRLEPRAQQNRTVRERIQQRPPSSASARNREGSSIVSVLWPAPVGCDTENVRNTMFEGWHPSGLRLHNGEMMRANAASVRLVHHSWQVSAHGERSL